MRWMCSAVLVLACSSSAHELAAPPKSVPSFQPLRDVSRVQIGIVFDQEERLVMMTAPLVMPPELQSLPVPEDQPLLLRLDDATASERFKSLPEENKTGSYLGYFADGHVARAEQIGVFFSAEPCDGQMLFSRLLQLSEALPEVGSPILFFPEPQPPNIPSAARRVEILRQVPSELESFVASHTWRFSLGELLWYVVKGDVDGKKGDEYFVARASVEWVGDRDVRSAAIESFWLRKNNKGIWETWLRKTRTLSPEEVVEFHPLGSWERLIDAPRMFSDFDGDQAAEVLFETSGGWVLLSYKEQRFVSTSVGYQRLCDSPY